MDPVILSPSNCDNDSVTEGKALWLKAMRWRRTVDHELAAVQLTFTQWLVLDAASELIKETGDAICQNAIATRTELDRMTVSQVMRALDQKGLVSRGPCLGRPAYRIWLTAKGDTAVVVGQARVKTASLRQHRDAKS